MTLVKFASFSINGKGNGNGNGKDMVGPQVPIHKNIYTARDHFSMKTIEIHEKSLWILSFMASC